MEILKKIWRLLRSMLTQSPTSPVRNTVTNGSNNIQGYNVNVKHKK